MGPFFSVVMPSYLGRYKNAALDRDRKILRAIRSVVNQSYKNCELLVIADGCRETMNIVQNNVANDIIPVNLHYIKKAKMWSGIPRNTGIEKAVGEWICYLDIDDIFLPDHLQILHDQIQKHPEADWVWFNDYSYNINEKRFDEHGINIERQGQCGTSNICHKRSMKAMWPRGGTYLHDWRFINTLKAISRNYVKIETPGYGICHVPHLLDI